MAAGRSSAASATSGADHVPRSPTATARSLRADHAEPLDLRGLHRVRARHHDPLQPRLAAAIATLRMPGVESSSPSKRLRPRTPARATGREGSVGSLPARSSRVGDRVRAFLADVRRGEVDDDAPQWPFELRTLHGGTDPFASVLDACTGKARDDERRSPRPTCASTVTRCPPTPSTATPRTRPYMAPDDTPDHRHEAVTSGPRASIADARAARPSGTGADRCPRSRALAGRARTTRRTDLEGGARLAVRNRCGSPHRPDLYPEMRRTFFGERGRPGPAPSHGSGSDEVFAEFRDRLAPFAFAAQHPGSNSYFPHRRS